MRQSIPMLEPVGSRITRHLALAAALAAVVLVTLIFQAIPGVNALTVGFGYLITILVVAASCGLAESIVTSVAATICFSYFFLPPVRTLAIADPENWVALFTFLISSLIASQLSDRARRRTVEARSRQVEMERLYALSRAIMLMDGNQPVGARLAEELARICEIPAVGIYDRSSEAFYYGGRTEKYFYVVAPLKEKAGIGSQSKNEKKGKMFSPLSLRGKGNGNLALY